MNITLCKYIINLTIIMISYKYKKGNFMEALLYFEKGYSCSESIVLEAIDLGLCDENLLPIATSFSGGMGVGCLCGAISGVQLIIGSLYGKNNKFNNEIKARQLATEVILKFKEKFPATCCRILSKDFEFGSHQRREHCKSIVEYCSKIMKEIALEKV